MRAMSVVPICGVTYALAGSPISRVSAKMMTVRARKMGIVPRNRPITYRTIAFTGPPSTLPRDLGFTRGNLKLRVDDFPVFYNQLAVEVHGLVHHDNVHVGLRACLAAQPPEEVSSECDVDASLDALDLLGLVKRRAGISPEICVGDHIGVRIVEGVKPPFEAESLIPSFDFDEPPAVDGQLDPLAQMHRLRERPHEVPRLQHHRAVHAIL